MVTRACIGVCAAASIVTLAWAADRPGAAPADLKKKYAAGVEQASAPTAQHKALDAFVGDFDQKTEVRMGPGAPMVFHSLAKGEWIMGGRFVRVDSRSAPDEEVSGERMTIYGFDTATGKYTMWTIESSATFGSGAEGDFDAATKTFTLLGERESPGAAPGAGAVKLPFKWTVRVGDGGVLVQEIAMKFPGAEAYAPVVKTTHTPRGK